MSKGKTLQPKFAVVLALAVVLVLIWYGYKAEWFKDVGVENTGAVAAVSSTNGKLIPGAKAVSGSTSSPQPVIAVTAYPTFEMKYDNAGNENNLVVKAQYSVTAQNGKLFIPTWGSIEIKDSLDRYATPATKVEVTALDPVSVTSCSLGGISGSCYIIPAGKTIKFSTKNTYNPKIMFGGTYSGKLVWLYFSLVANGSDFYYKPFPAQTSKLSTITIVGEKSPYLYTTVSTIIQGQNISLKGIRLTGSKPVVDGADVNGIVQQDDGYIVFTSKLTPGVYRVYMSHPTYGNSNNAWVTVVKPGRPAISLISSNASVNSNDGADNDIGIFTIKYRVEAIGGTIYLGDIPQNYPINLTNPEPPISDGSFGLLYTVVKSGAPVFSGLSALTTFTTSDGASDEGPKSGIKLEEGESTEITLTVAKTNQGNASDDGLYQTFIRSIGWNIVDRSDYMMFDTGLYYKTPQVSLN